MSPLPTVCPDCDATFDPRDLIWKYGVAHCPACRHALVPQPEA